MPASKPTRWKADGVKALVWFHRWLGIATCVIFAMWFASGAVLVFQPFPALPRAEQMNGASNLQAVRIAPAEAVAAAGGEVMALRLVQRASVPSYIVETDKGSMAISAGDGRILPHLTNAEAVEIGSAFLKRRPIAVHGPMEYDQWIVDNGFDAVRPLFRIDAGDEAGTRIYISAQTGEVVQRTTRIERGWNWLGAVLHWVYFTPLRASFSAWDKIVWSLSLMTSLVAIAGMSLGVIRTLAVRRAGRKGLTFFRLKWMKYHHLLGLFLGIFVIGWIASGWLSMDHGRLFSDGRPGESELEAYHGGSIKEVIAQVNVATLNALPSNKEVRFTVLGGEALMVSTDVSGTISTFDTQGAPQGVASLDGRIHRALVRAWPEMDVANGQFVRPSDFYAVAEGMPKTVRRYDLEGREQTSVYVDGATGSIITVMDASRAAYSWLYYAIHTFKVPGLIGRPLLREILILIPLILGFAFSITCVVIGIQRLRKT